MRICPVLPVIRCCWAPCRRPGCSVADERVSKKFDNHKAMIAVHDMHYNFAQIRKSLRVTPWRITCGRWRKIVGLAG